MLKELIQSNQDYDKIISSIGSKYIKGRLVSEIVLPKRNLIKQTKFGFTSLDYIEDQFAELRADVIKFMDKGIMPNYPELYGILNPSNVYSYFFESENVDIKISKINGIKPELVTNNDDFLEQLKKQDLLQLRLKTAEANSGLVLSIAPASEMSREKFASSDFFQKYLLKLVQQYGFLIDKNIPWHLKSNMESPFVKIHYPTSKFNNYFESKYSQIFEYYKNYLQYISDTYVAEMESPFQYSEYCPNKDKFVLKTNIVTKKKLDDESILSFIIKVMCDQAGVSAEQREFIERATKIAEGLDNGQKLRYTDALLDHLH